MKRLMFLMILIVSVYSCSYKTNEAGFQQLCSNTLFNCNHQLTQVIITDVFSPPVCSRIYAYSNIAAYEALVASDSTQTYKSFAGKLNGLTPSPQPAKNIQYNYTVAAAIAFTTVAQKLVFNGDAVNAIEAAYLRELDSLHVDKILVDSSVAYGRSVGHHILEWAGKDGYLQRNSFVGYIVKKDPSRWVPTPPDYMDAVEVNWRTVRPFLLDSASEFRPAPPMKYDTAKRSSFYKQCYQVYNAVANPKPGDSAIAWYWDDNPNTSVTDGHITYFQQKNSPPGHWIHIACSVAQKEKYSSIKTASLLAQTSIALFDAFISCWEAKYYYNYVRPETFINKYIDKNWQPLIQTPPFPEYPSGHSTISASAAAVLTRFAGDNYSFTDSSEVPYGRPTKNFKSFFDASDQASVSRMYGGIHFINSLDTGRYVGREIGNMVIKKLD